MSRLHLFQGFGVELEYMIVDAGTYSVRPLADRLLAAEAGEETAELERGDIGWSNELALHVIELKTAGPAAGLAGLAARFQANVRRIDALLRPLGGALLPGGMHPWMDPHRETRLWPHENGPIYQAYHRIFDCRGHGWSNLQSAHLNLPFADDAEFARLHAAIRALLPLLPALAAASPLVEGRITGLLDNRLEFYRHNQQAVPQVAGRVIPEPAMSAAGYRQHILQPLYRAIAPHDPQGILQHEWLNSRGAIARFDRGAIEIRLLDTQECPRMDLAIQALAVAAIRRLTLDAAYPAERINAIGTEALAAQLGACIRDGDHAPLLAPQLTSLLGAPSWCATAGDLWQHLYEQERPQIPAELRAAVECLLARGCLARRMLRALGNAPAPAQLHAVAADLSDCLLGGEFYDP